MATLPKLEISGATFVLTGTMWKNRAAIETDIHRKGGYTAPRMKAGCTLVVASAMLTRNPRTNKWSVSAAAATGKVNKALSLGSMVYHEKMLRDALDSRTGVAQATRVSGVGGADPGSDEREASAKARAKKQAKSMRDKQKDAPPPEWDDEMQAKLDANLKETSELLAGF